MSMDAINAAIEQARTAAANVAPPQVPAVGVGYAAPAAYAPPPTTRPVTLGEMLAESGMRVDHYIKADKSGFLIGKDTLNSFDEVLVKFDLNAVQCFYGVRWGQSPAQYRRSLDRVTEMRQKKPWAQVVAEAMAADPRCRGDYPSADIPFTCLQELVGTKGDNKGKVMVTEGQTLGLTLSVTNWKDFAAFIKPYNDLVAAGQIPQNLTLQGKLVFAQRSKGSEVWGAATFVDFSAVGIADA